MIWNPWKRIRQLETDLAVLSERLDYETEEADRRIGNAIAGHYNRIQYEDRYRAAQLEQLTKAHIDLAGMRPAYFTGPADLASFFAETKGEGQ